MTGRKLTTIDDEAAAWAARALSGEMSAAEQQVLDAWLVADAHHRQAYIEYADVIALVDQVEASSAEKNLQCDLEDFAKTHNSRISWRIAAPAMAASITAIALFIGVFTQTTTDSVSYATKQGETLEVVLADGSSVSLNTNSQIEVTYTQENRQVRLVEGEALFDITRDRSRPFIVSSQNAEAVVVGTRFNVHATASETIVSVLSGVVEVDAAPNKLDRKPLSTTAVTLIAGQEVSVDETGAHEAVRSFNPDAVTSWRRGEAYYENEPLSAVIADLNRYYAIELILGDAEIGEIPVTGRFDLKNQAVTVEALSVALSLHAEKTETGNLVFLQNE